MGSFLSNKSKLKRYLGFLTEFGEFRFKRWLDENAYEFLEEVGVCSGQIVLDFGCGSGTYTIPAARIVGEFGLVYALDASRSALDRVEEKAKREGLGNIVRIEEGEFSLRLRDASVDHVLLIDVLHEIDDKEGVFDRIYRVLKPDGDVIVYPMHMDEEDVVKLVLNKSFTLKEKKLDGHILVFKKLHARESDG